MFIPLSSHTILTAEGLIPPRSNVDPTVLALIHVGFNGFTQNRLGSIQLTQVKDTVLEVILGNTQIKAAPLCWLSTDFAHSQLQLDAFL